ncbi:MAG: AsmA family protein [Alphaproteobacteria bacterium]|nr:MAG: hypothetical protein B6I23_03175 [Rickettsiaceae bacterium 4572_127]
MRLFHKKKNWKKPLFWSIGSLFFLCVFLFLSLPLILSPDSFATQIEKNLETQIGIPAKIEGDISIQFFPHPVIRAKKIKLVSQTQSIFIDKIDFHTTFFSLLREQNLLKDLTLQRVEISLKNLEQLKKIGISKLKNITIKNAVLKIRNHLFEDVDLTIYEENNLKFFSFKGNYKDATFGLTGQIHETKPQPFQAIIHFLGNRKFKANGNYFPKQKKIIGEFEGTIPSDFELLDFLNLNQLFPLKTIGEFDTDFSNFSLQNLLLENDTFSFGGHISYSKKQGLALKGQVHKCPIWLTSPELIEQIFLNHPKGKINIEKVKNTCVEWKTSADNESLEIEKISIKNKDAKFIFSGNGVLGSTPSFNGKITYKNPNFFLNGVIFSNNNFIKISDSKIKINNQNYFGNLTFNREKKEAKGLLKTTILDFSKNNFPIDFDGSFLAEKIIFEGKTIKNAQVETSIKKDKILFKNLVGQIDGEPIIADGILSDKEKRITINGTTGKFISTFFPNIMNSIILSPKNIYEANLELKETDKKTLKITQKGSDDFLQIIANLEKNKATGRLTFSSDSTKTITDEVPFLNSKLFNNSLMISGRFESENNYFQMPEVLIKIGSNELSGSLSKITLSNQPEWKINLNGDKILLDSLIKTTSFSPDIWDDTELLEWENLLKNKLEFSLSLTNLIGTRLGETFSLDINTKLQPQQFVARFFQKKGDIRLHFTHENSTYKGFIHSENYHLPESWLEQDSADISFGFLTMKSEFETSGNTPHKLFNNMIASFDLKSTDPTLFGMSPYYAVENAKKNLKDGKNAVRRAIILGLKNGQAPLEKMSCRGVLKNGKAIVKYGRFNSENLHNGTFDANFSPLRKEVSIRSRFGLKGLNTTPTDIIWKMEDGLLSPKKTVIINSPFAYDPAYLKHKMEEK